MQGRHLRVGGKVITGGRWDDQVREGLTEGGRGIGCEGHPNNAEMEIIPQRQGTWVVQILGRYISFW